MLISLALLATAGLRSTAHHAWKAQFDKSPITVVRTVIKGSNYVMITGGRPSSRYADGRYPVGKFVKDSGAAAGVNGTFFMMAAINSQNNKMIGPIMTEQNGFVSCIGKADSERLNNRPFVVWNHENILLTDYQPGDMNKREGLSPLMNDATDAFVAGAWLVRDGEPLTATAIKEHGPRDAQTPRKRTFIGVTSLGKFIAGASLGSVTSSALAIAAKEAGCEQAALMDSGFSTSLVVGAKTLASGHSTGSIPSRPVPHAIVVFGDIDKQEQR